jgi:hypothetical protein
MTDQPSAKYVIKVGEIGYYKCNEKNKTQSVVRNVLGCTHFDCKTKATELKTQFSFNPAIMNRGIRLEIVKIEDKLPIAA